MVSEVALIIRRGPRLLLVQRPSEGRWAGLWEFPHGPLPASADPTTAAARFAEELGLAIQVGNAVATVKHAVTRFRIAMVCLEARYLAGRLVNGIYAQSRWVRPEQLVDFPVSSPQRRLAKLITPGRDAEKRRGTNQF